MYLNVLPGWPEWRHTGPAMLPRTAVRQSKVTGVPATAPGLTASGAWLGLSHSHSAVTVPMAVSKEALALLKSGAQASTTPYPSVRPTDESAAE